MISIIYKRAHSKDIVLGNQVTLLSTLGNMLYQGGERTSQSRDQNIEIEYKLGNFVSLRTRKIDFFNTLVVPLHKLHLLSM